MEKRIQVIANTSMQHSLRGRSLKLKDLKSMVRGQCLLNVLRGINICGVWVTLRFLGLSSAQFLKAVGNRPTQYGVSSAQYF